jgi:hypothetical protein
VALMPDKASKSPWRQGWQASNAKAISQADELAERERQRRLVMPDQRRRDKASSERERRLRKGIGRGE